MNLKHVIAVVGLMIVFTGCKKEEGKRTEDETFVLQTGSTAEWKGYLETGYFNSGTIQLDRAEDFILKGSQIFGGSIRIPVASIVITNNLPAGGKLELLHHLQSSDFFNVTFNPYVFYTVTTADKTGTIDADGNNYLIKGKLFLLGKELPLDIPAKIMISATEVSIVSHFAFDRTKWGMTYATGNDLPADEKIRNDIHVEINLKATRF